ncbi:hypothetical protein NPIL_552181 [Nephila pilipes]|uniref:Uncharacterized protein n=1 Tax=Nephila pilipes TaxID=299642 RepID=A0A8X6JJ33_NEPPI|nr:hypothetical protein NPIL_552181 [Nephila pilipes]
MAFRSLIRGLRHTFRLRSRLRKLRFVIRDNRPLSTAICQQYENSYVPGKASTNLNQYKIVVPAGARQAGAAGKCETPGQQRLYRGLPASRCCVFGKATGNARPVRFSAACACAPAVAASAALLARFQAQHVLAHASEAAVRRAAARFCRKVRRSGMQCLLCVTAARYGGVQFVYPYESL